MNKFKKVLLGALSVLTLGLFVVTGTKATAATEYTSSGNYYAYKDSTTLELVYFGTGTQNNITITAASSTGDGGRSVTITDSIIPNGSAVASGNVFIKAKDDSKLSFTTTSPAIIKANVFCNSKNMTAKMYGTDGTTVLSSFTTPGSKVSTILGDDTVLPAGTYYFGGTSEINVFEIYVDLQVESTLTLNSIALSNYSTNANVGDALPTISNMTVTATYSDTSSVDVTSKASITVKNKETDESVSDTYPSAGTYTVTASYTYGETTKTASYDVTVTAPTYYTVTYHKVDNTTGEDSVKSGTAYSRKLTKLGYEFEGWKDSESGTTVNVTTITSDVEIWPVFSEQVVLTKGVTYDVTLSDFSDDTTLELNGTDSQFFVKRTATGKLRYESKRLNFGGNSNYLEFNIPSNSYAILTMNLAGSNANAQLAVEGDRVSLQSLTTEKTDYTMIAYNSTNAVKTIKLYRNTSNSVYMYSLSVSVYSKVTAINEAQSRGTGSAIRFAATLSNVGSLDVVTKWNYTLSMDGKTDVVGADKTTLYTAISGTNGKAAADNTYYIVLTVNNIPSSFNGQELKCKFTITLSDGTPITTEVVGETINVVTA